MLYPGQCLEPCEIDMLSRVCRIVCNENGTPLESQQAQRIASHLLKLFMNGLITEEELLDAERNRAGRLKQPLQHQLPPRNVMADSRCTSARKLPSSPAGAACLFTDGGEAIEAEFVNAGAGVEASQFTVAVLNEAIEVGDLGAQVPHPVK